MLLFSNRNDHRRGVFNESATSRNTMGHCPQLWLYTEQNQDIALEAFIKRRLENESCICVSLRFQFFSIILGDGGINENDFSYKFLKKK